MELFYFLDMEAGSFLDIIQLQMKKRKKWENLFFIIEAKS